jgi:hypothetical protein
MNKEIEAVIKISTNEESLELDGFTAELYRTFKEEVTLILLKLFHKTEREGNFLIHSMKPRLPYENHIMSQQKKKIYWKCGSSSACSLSVKS